MKNKIKNIIKLIALPIVAIVIVNSCSRDFLNEKPAGYATLEETGAGGAESAVFGLYSKMRTQGGVTDWLRYWFQSIRSDDAAKGSTASDAATMGNVLDGFQYSKTEATDNWNGHYALIYACNNVIAEIEATGATDAGTLTNIAEAKAIRAFAYFDLRRDYGEVPIVANKVETTADAIKPKSTVAQVDAFIKQDLEYAVTNLPVSWVTKYNGRLTKGMALAYLAKINLYEQNWAQALSYSEQVINSGQYSLVSSYKTLFSEAGNNSTESIFEIQLIRIGGVNYSNNYWESQGVRGSGSWDLGWGFNVPTSNLVNAYEAGDARKSVTILESGASDGYGLTLPAAPPLAQQYWNGKAYTDPAKRTAEGVNKNHWTNIKILRYADVLLMAAEAANELGQTSKAIAYLNPIRNRAGLANTTASSQSDVRNAIKKERRIEFALEGERFYDLVRWGDATTVLAPLGYSPKNALYPIPQTAIDQSGGVLVQNPNY